MKTANNHSSENKGREAGGLSQALKAFGVLGGIGIFFAVVIGICIFMGSLADDLLGLAYGGKLVGIILGVPVAFYLTYKQLKGII
ncbi:AtpZ/AtpI family protein [uncultured Anaerovibrio sp.]|uniref:AtpZ/AtpI family protein n=1 Tax=uncultured Anaerovibrio sp. TaxID=361586 RepID=UPI0026394610|nr:AtpZ/AtpI family protein [uncultured Anaerovibrio sp.]